MTLVGDAERQIEIHDEPIRCSAARTSCSRLSTTRRSRSRSNRQRAAVDEYRTEVGKRSERDRTVEVAMSKTGVDTGSFAVNPVNGKQIPDLGRGLRTRWFRRTGAVFACPAHDERAVTGYVRDALPLADHRGRQGRRRGDGGVYRRRPAREQRVPRRARHRAREGEDHHVARGPSSRQRYDRLLRDWLFSAPALTSEPFPLIEFSPTARSRKCRRDTSPSNCPRSSARKPTADGWPPLGARDRVARDDGSRRSADRRVARLTRCAAWAGRAGTTCASCRRSATSAAGRGQEEKY